MIFSDLHNTLITILQTNTQGCQYCLKSITASDQRVIAATTTTLADNTKRNDFELADKLLLLAAPQKQGDEKEQQRMSDIY